MRLYCYHLLAMDGLEKIGRYQVLERIGVGSFTVVYRGRDSFGGKPVAIKLCIAQEENLRTGFLRLAEASGRLQHPNIATVLEFGSGDGKPYLVEDYIEGEHLGWKIEGDEPLSMVQRLDYLLQIAEGLRYAHSQGVVHKSVSPRSIRIDSLHNVRITDFGIAQLASATSRLTQGGPHTNGYLAPEQTLGLRADARTDIFCFGALAYELLTYQRAFSADTLADFLAQVLESGIEPSDKRLKGLPFGVSELISHCLERDPSDRYRNFDPLIAELRPILERERSRKRLAAREADEKSRENEKSTEANGGSTLTNEDTQEIPPDLFANGNEQDQPDEHRTTAYFAEAAELETARKIAARGKAEAPASTATPLEVLPRQEKDSTDSAAKRSTEEKPPKAAAIPVPPAPEKKPGQELATSEPVPAAQATSARAMSAQEKVPVPPQTDQSVPPAAPAPARESGKKRRWWWAALLAIPILGSLALWGRGQSTPETPPPAPIPQAAAPLPTPAVKPAEVVGTLVIDALPWGQVTTVKDSSGGRVPVPSNPTTPLQLSLPPGSYSVELSHPDFEDPVLCEVEVDAETSTLCSAEFAKAAVTDYFKQSGWWQ